MKKRDYFRKPSGITFTTLYKLAFIIDSSYNLLVINRKEMKEPVKLIIAIVQDEDSSRLLSVLMQHGFGVTKLATTGGFLKAGNTTLLLGVDDNRLDDAIGVIESVCKSRKQISTASSTMVGGMTHGEYTAFPIEVTVGGATLFVLTVDQFLKV